MVSSLGEGKERGCDGSSAGGKHQCSLGSLQSSDDISSCVYGGVSPASVQVTCLCVYNMSGKNTQNGHDTTSNSNGQGKNKLDTPPPSRDISMYYHSNSNYSSKLSN